MWWSDKSFWTMVPLIRVVQLIKCYVPSQEVGRVISRRAVSPSCWHRSNFSHSVAHERFQLLVTKNPQQSYLAIRPETNCYSGVERCYEQSVEATRAAISSNLGRECGLSGAAWDLDTKIVVRVPCTNSVYFYQLHQTLHYTFSQMLVLKPMGQSSTWCREHVLQF